ncbi:MAG: hypothetical protein R3F38_19900 [Gammaproteobacteria bacterium]
MPTLLRMPDELYTQELAQVVAPQYALRTFQDALNGRPFHEPGFRSQVLEFLVRNYRAPAHLLDDAFNALLEDLKVARVLMLERMPMIRAYHWQPGSGEEKGRWVVPTYIFAEHRNMLQLALDNAKSDVPNAGIHEEQEKPTPKVPYRKTANPVPAALKPGSDLVDRLAKHTSGEVPLSPEESVKLRKDLGKMNETLSPGEQFIVPDYSQDEQAYIDENNQKFSNDIGMVYSPAAAVLGLPTRAITKDESKVAGAVTTGMAIEGATAISVLGKGNPMPRINRVTSPKSTQDTIPSRGYRPAIGERTITKTEYKKISSELRARVSLNAVDGHGHARHGSHTTLLQQENRIKTGIAPDGEKAPTPRATKFDSNQTEIEAVRRAQNEFDKQNAAKPYPTMITTPKGKVIPNTVAITVDGGKNGYGSGLEVIRDAQGKPLPGKPIGPTGQDYKAKVMFRFDPVTKKWNALTQYPSQN